MTLTNQKELSFLMVLAFPKASSTVGLDHLLLQVACALEKGRGEVKRRGVAEAIDRMRRSRNMRVEGDEAVKG